MCTRKTGLVGLDPCIAPLVWSADETSEAARELLLLRQVYGRITSRHNTAQYRQQDPTSKKNVDNVHEYLMDRSAYFCNDYHNFRAEAQRELTDKPRLRAILEPQVEARKKHSATWEEAQTTFYCWVRRGILLTLEEKGRTNVTAPDIILAGMTDDLKAKLAAVRAEYKGSFSAGGYNPRPKKAGSGYRLGTISEHGFGMAVDVDSSKNVHVGEESRWLLIQSIAGTTASTSTRSSWWKNDPRKLFDNIYNTNQNFVTALRSAMDTAEEAEHKGDAVITAVMAADANFKGVGEVFLKKWTNGFFTLKWELVSAFHTAGFNWGATFPKADLHHFEL